jgi:hypothetical protein
MATATGTEKGKTSFVEEFLKDHEDAGTKEVNAAWTSFGRTGTISDSLVGKIRRNLGLTKNGIGKKAKPAGTKPSTTPPKVTRKVTKKTATSGQSTSTSDMTPTKTDRQLSVTANNSRASDRNQLLIALEKDFDRLLFSVIELEGMSEVEEHIRTARRVISREIR